MVNSTNNYFVSYIMSNHFEITHTFFTPMINSKKLILGPIILPHILIFYSHLSFIRLKLVDPTTHILF